MGSDPHNFLDWLTKADLQAHQIVLERHFRCKKSRCKQSCPEPADIFCRNMYGILRTDAIKRNFCWNLPEIAGLGSDGFLNPESDTAWRSWTILWLQRKDLDRICSSRLCWICWVCQNQAWNKGQASTNPQKRKWSGYCVHVTGADCCLQCWFWRQNWVSKGWKRAFVERI
jgi:hypothetical protein